MSSSASSDEVLCIMSKIGVMSLRMILLGGLFLRLTALFWYLSTHGWKGETWEYEVIANNLLAGKGFVFLFHGSVYRSLCVPFFPAICAALHWLGGSGLGLYYVFQLSCALGIISLTYFLTTRLFGENAAGYAGWLVALDPASIVYQSYKVDAMA
jgi:4-amino-4-deoxy-L-arabinose transferase-like glycosyltransferase